MRVLKFVGLMLLLLLRQMKEGKSFWRVVNGIAACRRQSFKMEATGGATPRVRESVIFEGKTVALYSEKQLANLSRANLKQRKPLHGAMPEPAFL